MILKPSWEFSGRDVLQAMRGRVGFQVMNDQCLTLNINQLEEKESLWKMEEQLIDEAEKRILGIKYTS